MFTVTSFSEKILIEKANKALNELARFVRFSCLSVMIFCRIGTPIILNDKICLNGVFLNQAFSFKYFVFILIAI